MFRFFFVFFFKQKTAYEMRISDWSSDVCSSDLNFRSPFGHLSIALCATNIAKKKLRNGSVAKIVKLEHAWRRLDGRNDDGFQVAPFPGDVILWAVRWYCRYPISYRDLEEMLAERGISVDHR